jgi:hypothetical protein
MQSTSWSLGAARNLSYRNLLEDRGLFAGTINVRLAAVRRLDFEVADCGLLSLELTAGIHRLNHPTIPLGNWLTADKANTF